VTFIQANYDGQVAAMDDALGELIAELKARGRYERSLIIVTADHGELLGEHGSVGHMGRMLYEPLLHIPLVVKYPGADHPRGRVEDPVQTVDVAPTALHEAGAAVPPGWQGQDLRPATPPARAGASPRRTSIPSWWPTTGRPTIARCGCCSTATGSSSRRRAGSACSSISPVTRGRTTTSLRPSPTAWTSSRAGSRIA